LSAPATTSDIQVRSVKADNFMKLASDKKLYFRDSSIYIQSADDGYLDLVADLGIRIQNLTKVLISLTLASDHTIGAGATVLNDQTAGENLVFGNIVYLKLSDGKWWKTDADAAATTTGLTGFVTETIAADATGDIMIRGTARDDSWAWTTGGSSLPLYISTTPGGLTESPPVGAGDCARIVAHSTSATTIFFNSDSSWVES
jgi:hypothetical protein